MAFNLKQAKGADLILRWTKDKAWVKEQPIMRLGGIAGAGKTYFMREMKDILKLKRGRYLAMGYTGQSANRMRMVGWDARTYHSTMMKPKYGKITDMHGNTLECGGIPRMEMKWDFITELPDDIDFIWIDEASFLPKHFLDKVVELAAYRLIPILLTGDPIQLPPVIGEQCFHMDNLDIFFDEPMRQAKDSMLIKFANQLRLGERVDVDAYNIDSRKRKTGNVTFLHQNENLKKFYKNAGVLLGHSDMIITSTNKQRNGLTKMIREYKLHTDNPYPIKGERLICRKNNFNLMVGDVPLTNGTLGYNMSSILRSNIDRKSGIYYMDFQPMDYKADYFDNLICDYNFLNEPFGPEKKADKFNPGMKFEFAQAITTHLSQGAQFPVVSFLDRYTKDEEYTMRVRYTAVTRAMENLFFFI